MSVYRQKKLFVHILNSNRDVKGSELSKKFRVSSRTIRTDVNKINDRLKEEGVKISSSTRKGYFIEDKYKEKAYKIIEKDNKNKISLYIPCEPSERRQYIVLNLLFSCEYKTMDYYSEKLFVSKTTIAKDLQEILLFLSSYKSLSLIISQTRGAKIEGDELEKRRLISDLIKMGYKNIEFLFENAENDIFYISGLLKEFLEESKLYLVHDDFEYLVKEIYFQTKRLKFSQCLKQYRIKTIKNIDYLDDLTEKLQKKFNIKFSNLEFNYLYNLIESKRILKCGNKYLEKNFRTKTIEIVNSFLQKIYENFRIDFSEDRELILNLLLHMEPMIERIKKREFIENPFKKEIKINYPFAYEISMTLAPIIMEELQISIDDSEIAYIALHIELALSKISQPLDTIILCSSTLGLAQLLQNKLKSYFHNRINILGYFPVYELDNILNGEYGKVDLIISTSSIEKYSSIPILKVNPIISIEDIGRIEKYVKDELIFNNIYLESDKESFFIKDELFTYFDEEIEYLDAIKHLSEQLEEEGYIKDSIIFYNSVCQRENLFSTILDNKVAIPHPLKPMSLTSVISVGVFKKPVKYLNKEIRIILLFSINSQEEKKLKILYQLLNNILSNNKKIKELYLAKNYSDFMEILKY